MGRLEMTKVPLLDAHIKHMKNWGMGFFAFSHIMARNFLWAL
jgi:hypothetical protein